MGAQEIAIIGAFVAGTAFLLSPVMIVRMIIAHREKMKAMEQGANAPSLVAEMQNLRREMAQMRETSTQFDMSLDVFNPGDAARRQNRNPHRLRKLSCCRRVHAPKHTVAGNIGKKQALCAEIAHPPPELRRRLVGGLRPPMHRHKTAGNIRPDDNALSERSQEFPRKRSILRCRCSRHNPRRAQIEQLFRRRNRANSARDLYRHLGNRR